LIGRKQAICVFGALSQRYLSKVGIHPEAIRSQIRMFHLGDQFLWRDDVSHTQCVAKRPCQPARNAYIKIHILIRHPHH